MKTEYNLFEQILLRVAKERNSYKYLKKIYNRNEIIKNIKIFDKGNNSICLSQLLSRNTFFEHKFHFWNQVSIIIYELLRKRLCDFFTKNDVLYRFTSNLVSHQKIIYFKPTKINNINELINVCIYTQVSPLNLIIVAFNWENTKEKFEFWRDINIKYRTFIYKLLFGESYE